METMLAQVNWSNERKCDIDSDNIATIVREKVFGMRLPQTFSSSVIYLMLLILIHSQFQKVILHKFIGFQWAISIEYWAMNIPHLIYIDINVESVTNRALRKIPSRIQFIYDEYNIVESHRWC